MKELLNINFDKKTLKLMKIFNIISFIFCFIGIFTLYIFNEYYINKILYEISLAFFKTGIVINIFSIICGIFFTKIKS